ncbi:hypothetical protein FH603_5312 [Spirosoma sp. LMG 31447]|uniref:Uncharacterized protein n=1 Tax=Spirosoma utsteinense TaxID=2585773 RepID=A0ABR6WDZ7_9BACT|nr:hypothetical protein [Spirosoma utsteinense]
MIFTGYIHSDEIVQLGWVPGDGFSSLLRDVITVSGK